MQLPTVSRPNRVRRVLAVSAAAAAVMVGPTACDYTAYAGGQSSYDASGAHGAGGTTHGSHDAQDPVVVPVGNTTQSTSDAAADGSAAATTTARRGDRDRQGRRYWKNSYGQSATTTATIPTPGGNGGGTGGAVGGGAVGGGVVAGGAGGGSATADPAATTTAAPVETAAPPASAGATATAPAAPAGNNGLDVLGRDCANSKLTPHDGFQKSPACVSTAMGEIAAEDKLPSLLITESPKAVGVGQAFTLKVSTRNLVRDRFLGAAVGGYYLESSFLNDQGLQRGHFHTACRILPSTAEAPDSGKAPEFFVATQDNEGGAAPDVVTINVPGIKTAGELQCTSWAGDGSHRTPMMTKANETPAIDSVRITVSGDGAVPGVEASAAPTATGAAADTAVPVETAAPAAQENTGSAGQGATRPATADGVVGGDAANENKATGDATNADTANADADADKATATSKAPAGDDAGNNN